MGQNTQNRVNVDISNVKVDQDMFSDGQVSQMEDTKSIIRSEEGAAEAAKEAKIQKQLDLMSKVKK